MPDDVLMVLAAAEDRVIVTDNASDFAGVSVCPVLLVLKVWWPSASLTTSLANALDRWDQRNPQAGKWAHWLRAFRRLRYVRYADDILLGYAGPKAEAEEIKRRLAQFLRDDLKLELSDTKTLITHARTSVARFLGYEITTQHADHVITGGRRATNGQIGLGVPRDVIKAKCSRYMRGGKPAERPELMNEEDHAIISRYGAEYRGIVQYYLLAGDVYRLSRLRWVMATSLLKTLAGKYDSSVSKMGRKYAAIIETPHGPRKCMQVKVNRSEGRRPLVATFGGIPLRRQRNAVLTDREPAWDTPRGSELIRRLLRGRCELCGQTAPVQVHQIRKLADLDNPRQPEQPEWMRTMAKRRRKTLVVCQAGHDNIHLNKPTAIAA